MTFLKLPLGDDGELDLETAENLIKRKEFIAGR